MGNDEARREQMEELKRDVERERFERRDALNKIRYEFEEFVHKKIDRIVEEVEHFKDVEDGDDVDTWQEIDHVTTEIAQLKEGLVQVQTSWKTLVQNQLED